MIDLSSVIDFSLYRSKALVNSSHLFNLTINSVIFEEKLSVNTVCFLSLDPVCILCSVSFGLIDSYTCSLTCIINHLDLHPSSQYLSYLFNFSLPLGRSRLPWPGSHFPKHAQCISRVQGLKLSFYNYI